MAIQVVTDTHFELINKLFNEAAKSIQIISPFIGKKMADILCDKMSKRPELTVTLITRFYRNDFVEGVSNLYALQRLIECGAKVYALRGLHAKLYLFDEMRALVGSANFTLGGFGNNYELSLYIDSEEKVNADLCKMFSSTLDKIKASGDFLITIEQIKEEVVLVNRDLERRKDPKAKYSNFTQFGAEIETDDNVEESEVSDSVQDALDKKDAETRYTYAGAAENIWLKFEASSGNRFLISNKWTPTKTIDGRLVTNYPNNRGAGIKDGDVVFIAVVSKDEQGRDLMPYIVARGTMSSYKEATPQMKQQYDWMKKWPNYSELLELEYLNTPAENSISLLRVLSDLGATTYPGAEEEQRQGRDLSVQELRMRHHQKSYMRITSQARDYINDLFDYLVIKHGSKIIKKRPPVVQTPAATQIQSDAT